MTNKFIKNKKGFTLFELIVIITIITIIAILALLAISKLTRYVKAAEVTNIINDTKVAEDKVSEYMIKNNDAIPSSGTLVPINDIKTAINERKLYNSKGLATAIDVSKTYEIIDTDYIKTETKTNLSGDFISSTDGENVYYLSNEKIENIEDITKFVKLFGGSSGETVCDIEETLDGGYVIVGQTTSNDGDFEGMQKGLYDGFIEKFDSEGNKEWAKTFGGEYMDSFQSVIITDDNGYIVVGNAWGDGDMEGISTFLWEAVLVKYNSSGDIEWITPFGGSDSESFMDIEKSLDGNLIAVGTTDSIDGDLEALDYGLEDCSDGLLTKFDTNGTLLWAKTFTTNGDVNFLNVLPTNDGFVAVGNLYIDDALDYEGLIVKFDLNGNVLWSDTLGGSYEDNFLSICSASDGGYLVTLESYSDDGDLTGNHYGTIDTSDVFIIKYSESGNVFGIKNFGGSMDETLATLTSTKDGGYLFGTTSFSLDGIYTGYHNGTEDNCDMIMIKLDKDLNIEWIENMNSLDSWDFFGDIKELKNGGYIASGCTFSTNFAFDYSGEGNSMLIKFDAAGNYN